MRSTQVISLTTLTTDLYLISIPYIYICYCYGRILSHDTYDRLKDNFSGFSGEDIHDDARPFDPGQCCHHLLLETGITGQKTKKGTCDSICRHNRAVTLLLSAVVGQFILLVLSDVTPGKDCVRLQHLNRLIC